jgi:hypothetical protein
MLYDCGMTDEDSGSLNGINVYNEKSLHAALKQWYARPGDRLEIRVDGFIIDLVREDLLVEVQTGSFSPLKRKLFALVQTHPVRLVFPIAQEKWIVQQPKNEHEAPSRRKSPYHGRVEHVFAQLVYIPALIMHPNFSLEILLTREEELRRFDEKKGWRRKGWVTVERRLLEVVDRRISHSVDELVSLLPMEPTASFTVREAAKAMRQPVWLAQKTVYCLKEMGVISLTGRKGRANVYTWAQQGES